MLFNHTVRFLAVASLVSFPLVGCSSATDNTEEASADIKAVPVTKSGHFTTVIGADGKTYFELLAGNNKTVLTSLGYSSASAAKKGMTAALEAAEDSTNFELVEVAGGYSFDLVDARGVIGSGASYPSKTSAKNGAATARAILLGLEPSTDP